MASNWTKPFDITYPLTAVQAERIDSMFTKLFSTLPLKATRGGTGLGVGDLAVGDLLYGDESSGESVISTLTSVAAGSYLRSGGLLTAPVWSTVTLPNTAVAGDLWYASATNVISALTIGTAGKVVRSSGTAPAYTTFTIPDTFAQGDVIYASAANVLTALAKDTNATRYLSNKGTSNAPQWSQVTLTNGVTGTLPVGNGGTGRTSIGEGSIIQGNAGVFIETTIGSAGAYLRAASGIAVWSTLILPNAASQGDLFYSDTTNNMARLTKNASATRYLSNTGASNNPAWAQVDLTNGVTGVLPAANGGSGASGFTDGSIPFVASSVFAQDNANLFWDDSDNRLEIGDSSAYGTLGSTVQFFVNGISLFTRDGSGLTTNQFVVRNDDTTAGNAINFDFQSKDSGGTVYTAFAFRGVMSSHTDGAEAGLLQLRVSSGGTARPGIGVDSTRNIIIGDGASNTMASPPGTGTGGIVFPDGTAPSSLGSNTAILYANDVSGTVRMFAIDEAGVTGAITVQNQSLTSGRVPYATTSGVLTDNAALLFDGTLLATTMPIQSTGSTNNRAKLNKILYGATTDAATAVELTTDGAAGSGATNRIAVPADTALSVILNICVKESGSASAKQMLRQFVISNTGGTTALQGSVTTLGTDVGTAGLATVSCTITANDTDDCIKVEVNGVAATNLRYTAQVISVEALYA